MLDLESRFAARVSGVCSIGQAVSGASQAAGNVASAGINAAGAVAAAGIGAAATEAAATTEANAAKYAADQQMAMYNQTRGDLMPYMSTGQNALSQLANLWGIGPGGAGGGPNAAAATQALTQFPGYQFGLNQGVTALDRSAASRGLVLSGAQLQDAQTFGQQYGMQQAWTPYVTQLGAMATTGEDAAAKVGANAMTTAQNVGQDMMSAGQATAAGQIGLGNQLQSGLTNALLAYQQRGSSNYGPSVTGTDIGGNPVFAGSGAYVSGVDSQGNPVFG